VKLNVGFVGFGNVGQAVLRFMRDRQKLLWERHRLAIEIAFVADIYGIVRSGAASAGLDPDLLLDRMQRTGRVIDFPGGERMASLEDALAARRPDLIVESTWTNYKDAQPALNYLLLALSKGISVVSCNKGPFALAYSTLKQAAEQTGATLRFGAAAPAAIPCINVAHYDLPACEILGFEAIVNDTTNYMLSQMEAEDRSFEESLRHAQDTGLAEKDPSLDVDGWDTAAKVVILANSMMGTLAALPDVTVEGISGITQPDVERAKGANRVIKLIGSARREADKVQLAVRPTALSNEHPLARVKGLRKGIVFHTDIYGDITVYSGHMGLETTAATIVTDVINVARALAASR
jgi:homoserine dehydrogenase